MGIIGKKYQIQIMQFNYRNHVRPVCEIYMNIP